MMNHPEAIQRLDPQQIRQGMPVYDARGKKVGIVSVYGMQDTHLVVQRGWLLHHDVHIPVRAVQRADAHGVYLLVNKKDVDEVGAEGWASLGEVSLETGTPASADVGEVGNIPDGGDVVGAATDTGVPTGLPLRSEHEAEMPGAAHDPASAPQDQPAESADIAPPP